MAKDAAEEQESAEGPRPFTQILHEQRRGGLHEELTEQLAELVRAVGQTGKQGVLTLKLTVKPAGDSMVQMFDLVAINPPQESKDPSIFYTDESGSVHRSDPRQAELPLRRVGGAVANA